MKKSNLVIKIIGLSILSILLGIVVNIYYTGTKKDTIPFLENELYYWDTKAKVVYEVDKFMKDKATNHNISPILVVKYADKYDIDIRLFLTQGLLESHYGTKGLARKTHSVCNVGAWDDGTITHRYSHPDESIEPYFKLIKEQYLVDKTEDALLKNFVNKQGNRYATYPYYEQELQRYWRQINETTPLDSLLEVYRYYKVELNR